jgi:hypothetical protein
VQQLVVRREDRQARHPEFDGHAPRRGDPLTRPKAAGQDGLPDAIVDLTMKRRARAPVDRQMESGHADNIRNGAGGSTAEFDMNRCRW